MKGVGLLPLDALRLAAGLLKGAWRETLLLCLVPIAILEAGVVVATRAAASRLLSMDDGVAAPSLVDARLTAALLAAVLLFMALRTAGVTALWALALRRVTAGSVQLSSSLFSSYLHWPYTRLMGQDRSRMFENLRTASRSLSQDIATPLLLLISELMVAAAIVLALLVLAPAATLFLILWFSLVFGVLLSLLTRRSERLSEQKWTAFRDLQELDRWTFRQFRNVRLTGQERQLTERHEVLSRRAGGITAKLFLLTSFPRHVGEMALLGSMLILFGWFSVQGHDPVLIMQEIAMLSVASLRLLPAGQRAVSLAHQLQQKLPSLRDLLDDLEQPLVPLSEPPRRIDEKPLFRDALSLEKVSFAYENGVVAVPRGTSLYLRQGEWLHVSGPSGTGKTTLVSLLLGLLPAQEGTATIDGRPVDMLSELRGGAVAMVPQDASMVAGTIHENLSFPFAPSAINADAARGLLKAVGVQRSLEERIGEDGTSLSGGQKQKLAIIRALLLRPELLILDEATSQIDREGEIAIFSLIRRELPEATVVVIAHKLMSQAGIDRLWVHRDGRWENSALAASVSPPPAQQDTGNNGA